MKIAVLLSVLSVALAQDWNPILPHESYEKNHFPLSHSFSSLVSQQYEPSHSQAPIGGGQCDLYKVGFSQDLYFQYIQYKFNMPELKEFTLCYWNKFTNHSNDHPIFSYAVDGQPRAIYSWISNTDRSSYFSMSVEGQTMYRLNYPLRLNRWYHTCQSWNGKTGEWQIWVNAERVGRGFHNRLVGHTVPAGGVAISGQQQSQIGGGFLEGKDAPRGSGGMLGEITLLKLYSVALTAGKAHKDHKHHHVHKFDHNGAEITTMPPPTPAPRPPQPTHPLLTGGQLNPGIALTIAAQQQPQLVQGQQFNAQFSNGQFSSGFVSQQLTQSQSPQTFQPPQPQSQIQQLFQGQQQQQQQPQSVQFIPNGQNDIGSYSQQSLSIGGRPLLNSGLVHPSLSQLETHNLFKREHGKFKRQTNNADKHKRELVLSGGHIVDDSIFAGDFDQSLLDGLAGIGENRPVLQEQMKMEEREPAEAEVKAVMNVCSGCDAEPFAKALIFDWRSVAKKLYSGAVYTPARTECRVF
ncbi:PREDICTED: uncharacterized protein LOC108561848 [Nicrophorus vespilloides]|uniref:Uncharacterized protein LOC108561848 n=1 Tax=Nicrophorus vespilloides TaxID=110193 RepID=A0ABM1MLI1_NICVS|nr:PREDICTED: uncharacterized protein LOC108561848 [Nicrophorus vespilloides]XP_017775431.1 PREDICTED: uncharacterized protein LOC108561848 [Nicrophorus vespilloides]